MIENAMNKPSKLAELINNKKKKPQNDIEG